MATDRYVLEPSAEDMRRDVEAVLNHVVAYLASLDDQPARIEEGIPLVMATLGEELPETGVALGSALDVVFQHALPPGNNSAAGSYLAFIPGGGLFHAALGDFIANAVNRFGTAWHASPGMVELEHVVVGWLCALVGFGANSGGFLTSGGSLANFSAIFTARKIRLGDDFGNGVLYASDQVHHSVTKAAVLAGFRRDQVRNIATTKECAIRCDALADAIAIDAREGKRPFLIVGNAGTTNTGAVDDLATLADIATARGMWLHIDGAYGGFFLLTERGRKLFTGIERADSVTLDPHKGMFLPYGTGALVVRDVETLRMAHEMNAEYLSELTSNPERIDFSQLSPELSRECRGLRVWLPLKLFGASAFRAALDEKLELTALAAQRIAAMPGVELVTTPKLSIVAFRAHCEGASLEDRNRFNREWLARVNRRGRVLLSGTTLAGAYTLRICVLCFRTHRQHVDAACEDLASELEAMGSAV